MMQWCSGPDPPAPGARRGLRQHAGELARELRHGADRRQLLDLAAVLGRAQQPGRQAQRSSETLEQNCADNDGTTTPARLDLTGCRNTTPTDIMKWARKTQRHLFPHLA